MRKRSRNFQQLADNLRFAVVVEAHAAAIGPGYALRKLLLRVQVGQPRPRFGLGGVLAVDNEPLPSRVSALQHTLTLRKVAKVPAVGVEPTTKPSALGSALPLSYTRIIGPQAPRQLAGRAPIRQGVTDIRRRCRTTGIALIRLACVLFPARAHAQASTYSAPLFVAVLACQDSFDPLRILLAVAPVRGLSFLTMSQVRQKRERSELFARKKWCTPVHHGAEGPGVQW